MRTPKGKQTMRPKLVRVSEEMRRICDALAQELLTWPGVTTRPMFGMRAFYRGGVIFAALPDKRAMENPTAISYKLPNGVELSEGEKWHSFELADDRAIGAALQRLDKAYRAAGAPS